jgi:hypothetical protein
MERSETVKSALVTAYRNGSTRVRDLAADLSDDQFWTNPYPYGNAFGHLVLHLTGNLNAFIGADIAGTDYVRDREREFTDPSRPPKEDVLRAFDRAVGLVIETLEAQTAESLTAAHPSERPEFGTRFGVFLTCAAHLQHHIGQMIYLQKELLRS